MRRIVAVGASLAGLRALETLRRDGFDGELVLIGDEATPPYDRPPLSKQVLAGEWDAERVALTDADALGELNITTRLGATATGLDLDAREVVLDGDQRESFDGLIIATGARPRELPTGGLGGIHTLRTLADAQAIGAAIDAGATRLVVVGAGFIGAEVAATARGRGLEVTMVEALEVPMGRALGDDIGGLCAQLHRDNGVDLRLGVSVDRFEGDGAVSSVMLADGSSVACDLVVVGIGVVPNTEWLDGSGLTLDNGVVCDETCLAAPGVVAAGDIARWPSVRFGETMRIEHWENAVEQGRHAARRLLVSDDEATPFDPVPWFWSDQYDRKMQLAGRIGGADKTHLVTGTHEEYRFATIFGRGDRIVGVFGMNRPRHIMQYRGLIEAGASWNEALEFGVPKP
jgi:3-phenylpropionate/trans-cinnamate dioxygenase ferredoxin reductase subunit